MKRDRKREACVATWSVTRLDVNRRRSTASRKRNGQGKLSTH